MSNSIRNFTNNPSMPERILSALAYLSFGVIGLVLIIISAIMKTHLKTFVKFNIYQAILISLIFFIVKYTYYLVVTILEFLKIIPAIGTLLNSFFHFLAYFLIGFPLVFGLSVVALAVFGIIIYLTVMSLMGKVPYIPFISSNIKRII